MSATFTVDGTAVTLDLKSFQPGMFVGDARLDMALTETDVGYEGEARLDLENELLAGGPPDIWKTLALRLEEMATVYSGDKMAIVASFAGEMESFGGKREPVTLTLVGSGERN